MKSYYGYCYTCPETKLLDYVGIGHEVDDANLGERMRSHLKSSHNRMLRQKINALRSAGLEPLFAKSVEGLTRSAIVKWEATTIRNAGCLRHGTEPLFNVASYEKPWGGRAFDCDFTDISDLSKHDHCLVDYLTLVDRICAVWDPERAATETLPPIHAFGLVFPTLRELQLDHRCIVPFATLLARTTDGEPADVAASRPLEWLGAFGERFESIKSLSNDERCIVSHWSLYTEIKRGVEHEYAATNERFREKYPRYHGLP